MNNLMVAIKKAPSLFVFLGVVGLLVVSRVIPHPSNFTALTAVALFSGSYWASQHWRFLAPLLALFVTDIFFGFYPGIEMNYIAVALSVLLAPSLQASLLTISVRGFLASVVFFVVSNFGVWLFSGLYPLSVNGLTTCFILAWPFYPATLASTFLYSGLLYGVYRLVFSKNKLQGFLKHKHG
jgi:hypothetical protein